MSETTTAVDRHGRAQKAFAQVLANVKTDQLDDPTPCPEWTVRDLIGHVVGGNQRVAGIAEPLPDAVEGMVAAHAASAKASQAVFAAPDGLTRTFDVPIGTIPGSRFIVLRTTDVLTHGWDLAQATGQSTDLDADLAGDMLELSRQFMRPEFRGEGRPFQTEQPCGEDAVVADRLAAFLGRPVS